MVDLDETTILLAAFVVLLVPFPLISYGTTEGIESLWWLGLALLLLGGVVPPIARYVFEDEEDEDESEDDQGDDDGSSNGADGDGDEDGTESTARRDDGGGEGDSDDGAGPDSGDPDAEREEE